MHAGALLAAQAMIKVPSAFAAALFKRPFVTLLNSMTDPTLPMTAHEYDEWGDPASADVVEMWAGLSPHKQIAPNQCAFPTSCCASLPRKVFGRDTRGSANDGALAEGSKTMLFPSSIHCTRCESRGTGHYQAT